MKKVCVIQILIVLNNKKHWKYDQKYINENILECAE